MLLCVSCLEDFYANVNKSQRFKWCWPEVFGVSRTIIPQNSWSDTVILSPAEKQCPTKAVLFHLSVCLSIHLSVHLSVHHTCLFSSPEHILRVSYCDHSPFRVWCPMSHIQPHLHLKHWFDFLGGPLKSCSKNLDSMLNSGCHDKGKNLLLLTHWS